MAGDTTTKLSIVIDAENKSDAVFKQVNDQLKTTNDKLKTFADASKIAAVAGTVAFAAISGVIVTTVKAASEADAKMAQFNTTMESMGKAGIKAKDALLSAANAAVKLGFDDEDTANSLAKLYQRTGDVTQAIKLNNLAMDLARAKSIDIESATNLVSLALSGSGRALLQYGIVIKDSATPLEALAILQEKVGGQANAFANTFAGNMAVMKVETDNLKEAIGGSLLPILTQLLKQIEPVILRTTDWISKNPELTKNILLVSGAIAGIVAVLGTLGVVMPAVVAGATAIGAALGLISLPALAVIALLGIIGTSVYFIVKNWNGAMEQLGIIWGNFKKGFMEGINIMIKGFQPLVDLFNMIVDGWKGIFGVLGKIGGAVGSVVKSGIDTVQSVVGGKSVNTTSTQAIPYAPKGGTTYQFNFNGDVNDQNALMKNIKSMLDRSASLVQIGG